MKLLKKGISVWKIASSTSPFIIRFGGCHPRYLFCSGEIALLDCPLRFDEKEASLKSDIYSVQERVLS